MLPKSFAYELQRIRWRVRVMSSPGGVDWLCEKAKKLGYKEDKLGPNLGDPP